jgi:enamine deaminase RidA (YjgF/YER057c/UK114 family)
VRVLRCSVLLGAVLTATAPLLAQARPRFINPPDMPPARGYSHVVEAPAGTRLVFVSGQLPLDRAGKLVGAGDVRAQAEQVFRNLDRALAAVGATFADVVKITIFMADVSRVPELRAVRDRYVNTKAPPASSLVEVRRFLQEGILVEIEAVAALQP